jgi:hypothetical protein
LWSSDTSANVQFFEGLINEASSQGLSVGIYTSYSQWQPIMGDYSGGSSYPLWYAHYDGNPSFSDFSPFNGFNFSAANPFQDGLPQTLNNTKEMQPFVEMMLI